MHRRRIIVTMWTFYNVIAENGRKKFCMIEFFLFFIEKTYMFISLKPLTKINEIAMLFNCSFLSNIWVCW